MNGAIVRALALNEVHLRMRRTSTIVALLVVVAISGAMIAVPSSGSMLMSINHARVLFTSSALALGGLGGFYLVRGRMTEDIRSGVGSVIGVTPVRSSLFIVSRWLGSVAYLGALVLAFMGAMLVCHTLRGDGPIDVLAYLQTYSLLLTPMVFFTASCAILFDSYAPLMGKAGDILFFFLWVVQMSLISLVNQAGGAISPLIVFDFSGIAVAVSAAATHFDAAHLAWMRVASGLIALLPLLPAVLLFHRFSPDQFKLSRARGR